MKIFLATAVLTGALGTVGLSQDIKPSPTPARDDIVRISTNLIQIDVTVTDANGNAVADLKPGEIEIYENGKKQAITNFSFVSSGRQAADTPANTVKNKNKITIPQSPLVVPQPGSIRRTTAIVIDDLSMSWESVAYTRGALK